MRPRRKSGNIILFLGVLIAMSAMSTSFLAVMGGGFKSDEKARNEARAFYLAEAGLNKAASALISRSVALPYNFTQNFGEGSFTVSAALNGLGSTEATVTSTGEAEGITRVVSQRLYVVQGLPPAFNYALMTGGNFTMRGSTTLQSGNTYVQGNASIGGTVSGGLVYHGGSLSGNGTYQDGGTPNPLPSVPTLDTSPYQAEINNAALYGVPSMTINSDLNLNGQTIYVNGNVSFSGTITIYGSGTIVATGDISISGNVTGANPGVRLVAGDDVAVSGSANLTQALVYASDEMDLSGSARFTDKSTVIANNSVDMTGAVTVSGVVFAQNAIDMSGSVSVYGSVVAGSGGLSSELTGNASITYQQDQIPPNIPGLSQSGNISVIAGTWSAP